MCEVLPRSGVFLICVFFAAASTATMAATTPMLETTTEGDECNWTRTDGMPFKTDQSCYLFISEIKSFYDANKSCEDEGAHLVSVGNEEENTVVFMKTDAAVWIGLYRLTNNSCAGNACTDWMWMDGSDPVYFNWGMFHANPALCVFMTEAGKWEHGRFCSENQSFVCEKNIPLTTSTSEPTTMIITSPMAETSVSNSATWGNVGSTPITSGFNASPSVPGTGKTSDKTEDKMPIIIGCVVGGLALVAIVTVVAVVFLKRHRTSRPIDQPVEVTDEETPPVDKHVRYNPAYEDVETNVTFKPSPGNTDTGAHGVVDNPHNIYSEATKKKDRPGSEGILVKENTLYGYGK